MCQGGGGCNFRAERQDMLERLAEGQLWDVSFALSCEEGHTRQSLSRASLGDA